MLTSIRDLTQARPHMRTSAQWTPPELRAYQEGYYWGVIMALRVAVEAAARYKLTTKTLRAASRRKQAG